MYGRKRNLRDILCKSDISTNCVPKENVVRNQLCNLGNCKSCPSFAKSNTILNSKNDRNMKIEHSGSCNRRNIIYAAEYKKNIKSCTSVEAKIKLTEDFTVIGSIERS